MLIIVLSLLVLAIAWVALETRTAHQVIARYAAEQREWQALLMQLEAKQDEYV